MTTQPQPPPEAKLIRSRREQPPNMSRRKAAERAGLSEGRWRQIENGGYYDRGRWKTETAPAPTLARMAAAVGVTGPELEAAGRADAAAELRALPRQLHDARRSLTQGQLDLIIDRLGDRIRDELRDILDDGTAEPESNNGTTGEQ